MSQTTTQNQETQEKAVPKKRGVSERRVSGCFPEGQPLTLELIEEFLDVMIEAGRASGTLDAYRRCLRQLYEYLPKEKIIHTGTINAWKQSMAESSDLLENSIKIYCTAANMFLEWCGRADLRGSTGTCTKKSNQPELTRKEFYRMLSAAKQTDNELVYLIVKTFGFLGNSVSELSSLTVESIKRGKVRFPRSGMAYIPFSFREELLDYARQTGCIRGPVFVSRNGVPLDRSNIWRYIQNLSADAQVDESKCTPRCLANMCRQMKEAIRHDMELLEVQMYERMLEKEQDGIDWRN